MLLEDYSAFERTARVMTKVHALSRTEVIEEHGMPGGEDSNEGGPKVPSNRDAVPTKPDAHTNGEADAAKETKAVLCEKILSVHDNNGNIPVTVPSSEGNGVHALETEVDDQPALKKKKKASSTTKKKMGLRRL